MVKKRNSSSGYPSWLFTNLRVNGCLPVRKIAVWLFTSYGVAYHMKFHKNSESFTCKELLTSQNWPKKRVSCMKYITCRSAWQLVMNWDTAGVLCIHSWSDCSLDLPQWAAADAEFKVPSDENTELKGSPINAWSRSIAMYAMPTAKDFFLANFYPSGPFTCIFSKTFPEFFLC